ncbi:MAG: DHH family phosphoesterase [Candidatus Hadarchaeales archaeon]
MERLLARGIEMIREHANDDVLIVSHTDADGICAASIMSLALDGIGVEHEVRFVRMLYREDVAELEPADLTIFTDLGSSQMENLKKFSGRDAIILDHHFPEPCDGWGGLVHINAHHHMMDGAREISGAGMAYLLARRMGASVSLSVLALIGAIGDVQDAWGSLIGKNREIAEDAMKCGAVERELDILLYGRHTRPLPRALQMFTDPLIPGVSNSPSGCMDMLRALRIPIRENGRWRRPVDLSWSEKRRLATELIMRAYMSVPRELSRYVPGLIVGEAYTLKSESSPHLRGADEFATWLNSTARQERPMTGFEIAKGGRGKCLSEALEIVRLQRKSIAKGMEFVEANGLRPGPRGYLQYFDASGAVRSMLVGTLTGVVLGSGMCDPYRPLVGMVSESGVTRISGRCSRLLFLRGLDMGHAFRRAAREAGGEGGGHAVACGAQLPEENVTQFLASLEEMLLSQCG